MKLYHATTPEAAKAILRDGFTDGTGTYLTDRTFSGVWLSDAPQDQELGVLGCLLEVTLTLSEGELAEYEWIEHGKPYREWLVPAEVVNRLATIRQADIS